MELNKESVHRVAASVGPLVLPPSDVSGVASLEAAPETGGISTGGSWESAPNGRWVICAIFLESSKPISLDTC